LGLIPSIATDFLCDFGQATTSLTKFTGCKLMLVENFFFRGKL